jgi:hypothetical protein
MELRVRDTKGLALLGRADNYWGSGRQKSRR